MARLNLVGLVFPGVEEAVENVVLVRRDDKAVHGQSHLVDHPAGEDVAEVPGGDDEGDIVAVVGGKLGEGVHVIDALGEDAHDVDRVDRGEPHLLLEGKITHELLHDGLGIVEGSLDRDGIDVVRARAGHLALLQLGDAALRIEDEDLRALLPGETVDRRRAGVSRGCPEDVDRFPGPLDLFLEEAADELQAEILEGKARAVEQLEDKQVVGELLQRRVHRVAEIPVAAVDDLDEVIAVVVGVEEAQKIPGKRGIGEGLLDEDALGQDRKMPRHVEASVGSESAGEGFGETDGLAAAAGRNKIHGGS